MTIEDPAFPKIVHRTVRNWADDITAKFNNGQVPFQVTTSVPTDAPEIGTIRLVDLGATRFIFGYFGGTIGWKSAALT